VLCVLVRALVLGVGVAALVVQLHACMAVACKLCLILCRQQVQLVGFSTAHETQAAQNMQCRHAAH
jgi:hypothetical protein